MNDSKAVPAAGMHRAKTWEIGFYALNNTSTNTYMMMMMYVSYLVGGIMGVGFALVSVLLTVMRVWDGVTDPIIGFMVDKTNGRLGKNRPFFIIGNLIWCARSLCFLWARSCRRILCSACCFSL